MQICPKCGTLMEETTGGWVCPQCGHWVPYTPIPCWWWHRWHPYPYY